MKYLSIIVLVCLQLSQAVAQELYRKDYSDHWIVLDGETGSYVPLVSDPTDERTIHFYLDLAADRGKAFELCADGEISIFINGSIVTNREEAECLTWSVDSLAQSYRSDSIQVSIFKIGMSTAVETSILYPALGFVPEENPVKVREQNSGGDFILFALITMGLLLILIRESNYRFFEEFSSFQKTFSLKIRSNPIYKLKPFSREIFQMAAIESLCISFFALSVGQFFPEVSGFVLIQDQAFVDFVWQWILWAMVFLAVIYSQFVVQFVINLFFHNSKLLHIQFYDNLRITFLYLASILLLLMVFYGISTELFRWAISYLWIPVVALFLLKSFVIYLKMLSESSFRRLHIFSYFCATEILPVALVVKIVFY